MKIAFGISWNDSKKGQLLAAVGLSLGLLFASMPGFGQSMAQATSEMVDVIVRELPGAGSAPEQMVEDLGGDVGRHIGLIDGFTATVPEAGLPALESVRNVHSVTRDRRVHLLHAVDGYDGATAAGSMYQARLAVKADDTWHDGFTGKGVDVALIDSGVLGVAALDGPGKLVRGPDFSEDAYDGDLRGLDAFGHGSHMAGVIAGDDAETGYRGIAPGARLVSVKVAGADGMTSLVRVLAALDWVRRNRSSGGLRIRVVNLSFGVDARRSYVREPLAYAAEQLWNRGVTVVAAAGNKADGTGSLDLPAADPFLLAVGASDTQNTESPDDDTVADFSSRDAVRPPDVVAPGTGVISLRVPGSTLDEEFPAARIGDRFFRGNGTSQAAAVVSGLVARLLQARPELTPDQVKALLKSGAVDLPADVSAAGAGRVDLARTLDMPAPAAAAQPFQPAQLDLRALWTDLTDEAAGTAPAVGTGENGWTGRSWSGRSWSGRSWSGRSWSGRSWSGNDWSGENGN
jgi:hypothetical protein